MRSFLLAWRRPVPSLRLSNKGLVLLLASEPWTASATAAGLGRGAMKGGTAPRLRPAGRRGPAGDTSSALRRVRGVSCARAAGATLCPLPQSSVLGAAGARPTSHRASGRPSGPSRPCLPLRRRLVSQGHSPPRKGLTATVLNPEPRPELPQPLTPP